MKITLNWLKRHINFHSNNILELLNQLEEVFIKLGLELENYKFVDPILAIKIFQCEKITNTDLYICKVNVPKYLKISEKILSIVCGAKNVKEDLISALCLPGTKINSGIIVRRKIHGHISEGMFASYEEINEESKNEGIIELSKEGIYKYQDVILEISVPTNRWDLKNVRSLARNLAFFKLGIFKDLPIKIKNEITFPYIIENNCEIVASFITVNNIELVQEVKQIMENIDQSSFSLQTLNDFVLIDIGHPIHIYDKDNINNKIQIIKSEQNIIVKTIKGEFKTSGKEILIKNNEEIIAIGGIIGCKGYTKQTKNVLIEAIYFTAENIPVILSEASKIFSLGIDHNQAVLLYISTLIEGEISNVHWSGSRNKIENKILFSNNFLYEQTGISLSLDKMKNILEEVGFKCEIIKSKRTDKVTDKFEIEIIAPSWRNDIEKDPFVIAEEIIKIIGYDKIGINKMIINKNNSHFDLISRIRLFLCDRGYIESINNPFSSSGSIKILNPIQNNKSYLREDLIESLLEVAQDTLSKGEKLCQIFEIGKIYPSEKEKLSILACGKARSTFYNKDPFSFFYFKELIYSLSSLLNIKEINIGKNYIEFSNGFIKILPDQDLIKNVFYAQFDLIASDTTKSPPRRYNYKNFSINFDKDWQSLLNHLSSCSQVGCEFLLADLYNNTYTITIKCPYEYSIDEVIKKIK